MCSADDRVPQLDLSASGDASVEMIRHHNKQLLKGKRDSDWIDINVGGRLFTTTRSTLVSREPESMLSTMFSKDWQNTRDSNGAYLIDRSPLYFEPILNYLRHGSLVLDTNTNPQGVLEEAIFFGLQGLVEQLEVMIMGKDVSHSKAILTRADVVHSMLTTNTVGKLRFQGINFTGADLSKLDLRYVNFKHAVLHKANLSGANLSCASLERADISHAVLDGANLMGAKMLCANMEKSSLKSCNFEDPAGSKANMEGVNLKYADLSCCQMSGVNLRVANLKNANMQNCDLKGAVLAGADLENCNLSGCDLHEANLRGANLEGVDFHFILSPLHMSQAIR